MVPGIDPREDEGLEECALPTDTLPNALHTAARGSLLPEGAALYVFLDYDGTLTPIVEDPELAVISAEGLDAVRALAKRDDTAIVTGRSTARTRRFLQVDSSDPSESPFIIAGSHGLRITGRGQEQLHPVGRVRACPRGSCVSHGTALLPKRRWPCRRVRPCNS